MPLRMLSKPPALAEPRYRFHVLGFEARSANHPPAGSLGTVLIRALVLAACVAGDSFS